MNSTDGKAILISDTQASSNIASGVFDCLNLKLQLLSRSAAKRVKCLNSRKRSSRGNSPSLKPSGSRESFNERMQPSGSIEQKPFLNERLSLKWQDSPLSTLCRSEPRDSPRRSSDLRWLSMCTRLKGLKLPKTF